VSPAAKRLRTGPRPSWLPSLLRCLVRARPKSKTWLRRRLHLSSTGCRRCGESVPGPRKARPSCGLSSPHEQTRARLDRLRPQGCDRSHPSCRKPSSRESSRSWSPMKKPADTLLFLFGFDRAANSADGGLGFPKENRREPLGFWPFFAYGSVGANNLLWADLRGTTVDAHSNNERQNTPDTLSFPLDPRWEGGRPWQRPHESADRHVRWPTYAGRGDL
jgi:hypothetical protein